MVCALLGPAPAVCGPGTLLSVSLAVGDNGSDFEGEPCCCRFSLSSLNFSSFSFFLCPQSLRSFSLACGCFFFFFFLGVFFLLYYYMRASSFWFRFACAWFPAWRFSTSYSSLLHYYRLSHLWSLAKITLYVLSAGPERLGLGHVRCARTACCWPTCICT